MKMQGETGDFLCANSLHKLPINGIFDMILKCKKIMGQ